MTHIEINNLRQTCDVCPSQWEFETYENRSVYVRYRYGNLTVQIGEPNSSVFETAGSSEYYIDKTIGGDWDGWISWAEVLIELELEHKGRNE